MRTNSHALGRIADVPLMVILFGLLAIGILPWVVPTALADSPGTWTATGSLAAPRHDPSAILLPNGKVLVAGGNDSAGNATVTAQLYDPATGTFAVTGSMANPRGAPHAAVLLPNGKVLFPGGVPVGDLFSAELYDPATGTFAATGPMMTVHGQAHSATLLPSGKVLVAGGFGSGGAVQASAELYDPGTGTFQSTGSMTTVRAGHTATLLPNGKVLITGGQATGFAGSAQASAELYDPATGTFSPTGAMSDGRTVHAATLLPSGKVLVTGGNGSGNVHIATAELYDPATNAFTPLPSMNSVRAQHSSTLLPSGKVLIAGGCIDCGASVVSAELYDPATSAFTPTGSMVTARIGIGHATVLLPTGKVLIAGGFNGAALASAELYCPEMPGTPHTFVPTGSLSTPRDVGSSPSNDARVLPTGKVLIAAGATTGGGGTTTAELYDPAAGTFAPTGPMTTARNGAASTLLPNGKVLYTGGVSGGPSFTSAELYDPTAGTFALTTGSMVAGRFAHGQILLPNGKVLLFAGSDGSNTGNCPTPSAELYDPASKTFTATGAMVVCRAGAGFSTTLLPTGKVLIAGGSLGASGGFASQSSAELYDPTTGTFTATGSMTISRVGHTGILLPTGKVLIVGGSGSASAELYDPTTGTFTATGSMATARTGHSAILLPTGKALIAGGTGVGTTFTSAELYDPAAGTFSPTGSMGTARAGFFSALLPTGQVLAAGGSQQPSGARLSTAELYSTAICAVSAPVITSISPTSGFVGTSVTITGSNFGATQGTSTVTFNGVTASVSSWSGTQIVATVPAGATTGPVVVTVNSVASNSDKTFSVITDTIAPTTTASVNPPANGAGWNNSNVTVTLTATDNAGGSGVQSITYTLTGAQVGAGSVAASSTSILISTEGVTTVTFHARDNAGNVEGDHSVTIKLDKTAPVLTVPANMTVNATSPSGAVVTFTPTATDNLDPSPVVTANPASGSTFPIGTTTVTVTATDQAGNTSTGTFTVTVVRALSSITVTPANPTINVGQTQQFTATGTFSDGTMQTLAGASAWTQLSPTGGPPRSRISHSAVHDPTSNRMIVFGGGETGTNDELNDVWVLQNADGLGGTPSWIQLAPTGTLPSARVRHRAVYDPATNRMMVFGGDPVVGFCFGDLNDVWVLSNANGLGGTPSWTQLSPAGTPPSPRATASVVYDQANNRMIVFGGQNECSSPDNQVWVLSNANGLGGTPTWTQLAPSGLSPAARSGAGAVYDPATNRMIIFGGQIASGAVVNDTWVLTNANGLGGTPTWIQLSPAGGPPLARVTTAVFDAANNRMTVFGGCCDTTGTRFSDAWVLANANGVGGTPTWTQLSPSGGPPSARDSHTAVINTTSNRMIVFAGRSCTPTLCSFLNDTWVLANANGSGSLTWSSGNTAVASINQTGLATGVSNGTSTITATSGSISGSATLLVDGIAPTTTASATPTANGAGWNNSNVTVTLTATDNVGGSGVQSITYTLTGAQVGAGSVAASSTSILISVEGVTTVTFHARDNAGNVEGDHSVTVKLDKTAPALTFGAASPAANAAGWNNTNVSVPFTAADNLSGVASASPVSPLVLTAEGAAVSGTVTVTDVAGNSATFTSAAFKIDKTAPTLNMPTLAASYIFNGTLTLTFSTSDGLSGVASSQATLNGSTVTSGTTVTLTKPGANTFTLAATDTAGNTASKSATFSVLYNFIGFLQPILNDGSRVFKLGSTVPVKFQLTDATGAVVSSATGTVTVQQFSGSTSINDPIDGVSSGGSNSGDFFRFDSTSGQYIFNLSTQPLVIGTWQVQAHLDDGTVHTVFIGLK